MKNKFSKLISLVLTCIMVMSVIQLPASAALEYGDVDALHQYGTFYIAPVEGKPFHIAYTQTGSASYTYGFNTPLTDYPGITVSSDGIFSISHDAVPADGFLQGAGVPAPNFRVTWTSDIDGGQSGVYKNIAPSRDFDFEDGTLPDPVDGYLFAGGTITTDGVTGNKYYASDSYFRLEGTRGALHLRSSSSFPTVLEFDGLNFSSWDPAHYSYASQSIINNSFPTDWVTAIKENGGSYYPLAGYDRTGWNHYKFIFKWRTHTYGGTNYLPYFDYYINDHLVIENGKLFLSGTDGGAATGDSDFYLYMRGYDNYKMYGSTLGFVSDVSSRIGVSGSNRTVEVLANHVRMPISNIPEEMEYAFYECGADGVIPTNATPIQQGFSGSYPINESTDIGKYIKVAARVKETIHDQCASEWVFSDNVIEITPIVTTPLFIGTKGTDGQSVRFMLSRDGINSGNKTWSILGDNDSDGVSVTTDGIIEISDNPSPVTLMSYDNDTFEIINYELSYDTASTSESIPLTRALSPVMFKADVSVSSLATVSAGSYDFEVTSDAESFKFIVEDDVRYLFVDDVFVDSAAFAEDILDISIANGAFTSYYAGSPLKNAGLFTSASIDNAYEYCEILTPVTTFYNESAVYPEAETYSYKWYLDGELVSEDASYVIPGGSEGKELYCIVTCTTDSDVSIKTNTRTVGPQYDLTVNSAGTANFELRATDTTVYVVFAGSDRVLFYDMDIDNSVTVSLTPGLEYKVLVLKKDTLVARGLGSIVNPSSETVVPVTLADGASPVVNLVVKNTSIMSTPAVPYHFEDPIAYADLVTHLSNDASYVDKTTIIADAFVSAEAIDSYDLSSKSQGLYRIINIEADGTVTEEVTEYNKLYKLFDNSSNYTCPVFESVATKALDLKFVCLNCHEYSDTAAAICDSCQTRGTVVEEYDVIMNYADTVSSLSDVIYLMGAEGKYFPASVALEIVSDQTVKSDGMLSFLAIQLEKAELSTGVPDLLAISSDYAGAVAIFNPLLGLETALDILTNHLILEEVELGFNTTNVRYALGYLGSTIYNNASQGAKEYAASSVSGRTYTDIPSLKLAVENAVGSYVPPVPDTNDDDNSTGSPSSNKVSITGPAVPPPVVAPASIFNDMQTTHWAYPYVQTMNKAGVLSGYNGNFRPEDDITRAEYAKVLATAFGLEAANDKGFADVSADAWYAQYVNTLASLGIVNGDNGNFRPNDAISRQDSAVMLHRLLTYLEIATEQGELSFTDKDAISEYALNAISALTKAGIINGMGDGSFAPSSSITRAQVAKIICVATKLGGDK